MYCAYRYFERDDGERFDVGSADASITQQIYEARWTGARIQVWGRLFTGVPAVEARHIEVDMGSVVLVACDGSLARRARARSSRGNQGRPARRPSLTPPR